jgi:pyruvate/2-oxoglutarate dehydrogenase complex dihydrolipoamide dehydrogenase (E3) component
VFLGDTHLIPKHAVEIEGARVEFSKAIIATGARAAEPDIPGLKEAGYLTNETVFSRTALPARLVVIGGGPIGCELAQGFRRLGSEVSVIGHASRLLPREEPEASALLTRQFQQEGIALFLAAKVLRVEQTKSAKRVFFESDNGSKEVVCDGILVAVGRAPNVEGLGLEAAGVAYDRRGVIVDDHLRTSNPDIYAAGDIASRFKFTHAAEALARIALQNALFFGRKKAGSLVIPWCTYTDPEVAHVGLYAKDAEERGIEFETVQLGLDNNDRAITDGETEGFIRVLMAKKSRQLRGATLVSTHAGESIGELVLAIERKLRLSDLSGVIHPYPTQADIIKRAGDASMKSRLKPWMKRLLTRIFAVRR